MMLERTTGDQGETGKAPNYITSVNVTDLFGEMDVNVEIRDRPAELARLLILYGDNGSGKTTLLNLIYRALATSPGRGIKGALARTPFRRLSITFDNGVVVGYRKKDLEPSDLYFFRESPEHGDVEIKVQVTNGRVYRDESTGYEPLIEELRSLDIDLYFLNDERMLETTAFSVEDERELDLRRAPREPGRRQRELYELRRSQELIAAVRRLESWFRYKIIHSTDEGERSATSSLVDVLRHIGKKQTGSSDEEIERVMKLQTRSQSFERYGFSVGIPGDEIVQIIKDTSEPDRSILSRVLFPFLDRYEARLDALQEIRDQLQLFLDTINSYLTRKRATFTVQHGLQITSTGGSILHPSQLSSGEKQMLLLFCNTIISRDRNSIFLIDEPELSLNIKWQRELLSSLMSFVAGTQNQFIIATHSIELLTQHSDHVALLSSKD